MKKNEVPKGYAETIKNEFSNYNFGFINKLKLGDYCGFKIYEDIDFSSLSKRASEAKKIFRIDSPFKLDSSSNMAIARGCCDTFDDAKYFIDQIFYRDAEIRYTLGKLRLEKERADKKSIISSLITNI